MDKRGNIHRIETDENTAKVLRKALEESIGDVVDIPPEEEKRVRRMNRKERRRWYAQQRKALKRSQREGA